MEHIRIFLNIFCLIIGTWAAVYALQFRRAYKYTFLSPILYFIVIFNVIVFSDLMAWYWMANLYTEPDAYNASFFGSLIIPLSYFLSITFFYFLIRVLFGFCSMSISNRTLMKFYFGILFSGSALIFINILAPDNIFQSWIKIAARGLSISVLFTVLFFLVLAIVKGKKHRDLKFGKMAVSFSSFYLMILVFLGSSNLLALDIRIYIVVSLVLMFNLFPLYWYKYCFLPYHRSKMDENGNGEIFDIACGHYGISRREREIAELILRGLKNQEIENRLFISPHTVKNHIYNIFKKVGVKSRTQLIRAMSEKPGDV
ncbi:response regulator transcription factor [candidate division KSB1 bacterium]